MPRQKKLNAPEVTSRLLVVQRMIVNLKDAMPNAAAEMRRDAYEEVGDLIEDLRRGIA